MGNGVLATRQKKPRRSGFHTTADVPGVGNRRQQVCLIEKEKPTGVLLIKHRSQGPTVLHREGCSILSTNLNEKRI